MFIIKIPPRSKELHESLPTMLAKVNNRDGYDSEAGLTCMDPSRSLSTAHIQSVVYYALSAYPGLRFTLQTVLRELAVTSYVRSQFGSGEGRDPLNSAIAAFAGYDMNSGEINSLPMLDPFLRIAVYRWMVGNRGSRFFISDDIVMALMVRRFNSSITVDKKRGVLLLQPPAADLCHLDRDLDNPSGFDLATGLGQTHARKGLGQLRDMGMQGVEKSALWEQAFWPWHIQMLWLQISVTHSAGAYRQQIERGPDPRWYSRPSLMLQSPFSHAYFWYYYYGQPRVMKGSVRRILDSPYNNEVTLESQMTKSGEKVWAIYNRGDFSFFHEYLMLGPVKGFTAGPTDEMLKLQSTNAESILKDILGEGDDDAIVKAKAEVYAAIKLFYLKHFSLLQTSGERAIDFSTGMRTTNVSIPGTFSILLNLNK